MQQVHGNGDKTFIDFNAYAFFNKYLVQQCKLALVENDKPMPIEVINSWNFSLRPITYETKTLEVTIGSHISKMVFNVISSPKNLVIIALFWLVLHNAQVDCIQRVFILKHQNTKP
jgi:hypothetical protein